MQVPRLLSPGLSGHLPPHRHHQRLRRDSWSRSKAVRGSFRGVTLQGTHPGSTRFATRAAGRGAEGESNCLRSSFLRRHPDDHAGPFARDLPSAGTELLPVVAAAGESSHEGPGSSRARPAGNPVCLHRQLRPVPWVSPSRGGVCAPDSPSAGTCS